MSASLPEKEEEEANGPLRTKLPAKASKNDCGIWSVLKNCVGKDLSKVTMPIQFNEPISFLQRAAEHMEYADLLGNVELAQNPVDRIQHVAAFAVSALASNWNRLGKPFNPVIGETYELRRNDYKLICEQVSHHPPVSAFQADSPSFDFHGWVYPKLKLWGKSVEIHPKGVMKLHMKKFNESYTWKNINCTVHGIIGGKMWIEHHGTMELHCVQTGLTLSLHFKPAGWFNKELHVVEGFVTDSKKTKHRYVYGKWTETLRSCDMEAYEDYMKANAHKLRLGEPASDTSKRSPIMSPIPGKKIFAKFNSLSLGKSFSTSVDPNSGQDGDLSPGNDEEPPKLDGEIPEIPNSVTLWEVRARPDYSAEFYHFTLFAMSLNQVLPDMSSICPTDSRLRPDIRKMEEGDLDKAAEEKGIIEEKQRKFLKTNNQADYKPVWFDKVGDDWICNGKYWIDSNKPHIAHLF
ncbi:oxysterol-binding protein-related protein 1 [Folsomia candida]|uniref:Oxysterol-binding protein n=1 Tax=Folsomia candida TaxID=158441 RepID=A0A226E494_FOLCA|nr:oxysterol-binding protein-related protein 1 [Folsomia candida]OXA51797.1 Oxysterol-binding protein-related protein 1 [Folsomia candida]